MPAITQPAGIYSMLYAFFDAKGRLDRAAMRRQVEACVKSAVHGVAALGLATEVAKLAESERRTLVEWVAEELAGRLPLAVTVVGATVAEQVAFARFAHSLGAAWVILQPPRIAGAGDAELVPFFSEVMERLDMTVAVQNAPEYIGVGLSHAGIARLARTHTHFTVLKGEGPALLIRELIEQTGGRLAVFNGRAGLELTDNLRAGCAGMVPGIDTMERQARIFDLMRAGEEARAEALYREILPAIVFAMQSVEHLVCYGKRLAAARLGLGPVHDRAPAQAPTEFGLRCVQRYARALGPLP
ncbi:MAG TPA: dihydrodipicolinate synthase family protein [Burkholderiales bacterium]|jgi:dihydrodipicolinate synthase/N-acetylneuraminate lyase|nr:dihydrodipicolinate synthase family protein [Burkholderiales bacterium]